MLKGKSAPIAGSWGGIGFATARALAALGCDVVLNGFAAAETIVARAADIEALGVKATDHGAELRHPAEIADMVAVAAPDIVVNNAVVRQFGAVENFAPEHWDEKLAVNLSAPFHTIRLSLPGMKARGWGRIVNMASIYGYFARQPCRLHHHQIRGGGADGHYVQRDMPGSGADAGHRLAPAAGNAARRHDVRRSLGSIPEYPPTVPPVQEGRQRGRANRLAVRVLQRRYQRRGAAGGWGMGGGTIGALGR